MNGASPPLQQMLAGLQAIFGGTPLAIYVLSGMFGWLTTVLIVLGFRHAIEAHWQSAKEWQEKVFLTVMPKDTDTQDLQTSTVQSLRLFRGRIMLNWRLNEVLSIQTNNLDVIRMVYTGHRLIAVSRTLYSANAIFSAALISTVLTGVVIFANLGKVFDKSYKPGSELIWFSVLSIWPLVLAYIQLTSMPNWRKLQQEVEQDDEHLTMLFGFDVAS